MAAATRSWSLFLTCFHGSGSDESGRLALRSRYPSMPRGPRAAAAIAGEGTAGGEGGSAVVVDLEAAAAEEEEEKVAVFAVSGMTCAACAGSVEKAVKRLPGIHEAAVDVLGGRVQVAFYTALVSVSIGYSTIFLRARVHLSFCPDPFACFSHGPLPDRLVLLRGSFSMFLG
ncbi:copper-transporting ATPase HMA5-like [Hordeum vulgare subsp. vulgare]|uniref:copper-transporting ATPase HMA5-like n=1 Tax=Hordeum vulgare subsp. vulgare TaxID=112509 RepID=UPI000B4677FD|nr:copper-transporting ATPase HMA5-like [Hordeum vulgare subsp. vulgare]